MLHPLIKRLRAAHLVMVDNKHTDESPPHTCRLSSAKSRPQDIECKNKNPDLPPFLHPGIYGGCFRDSSSSNGHTLFQSSTPSVLCFLSSPRSSHPYHPQYYLPFFCLTPKAGFLTWFSSTILTDWRYTSLRLLKYLVR